MGGQENDLGCTDRRVERPRGLESKDRGSSQFSKHFLSDLDQVNLPMHINEDRITWSMNLSWRFKEVMCAKVHTSRPPFCGNFSPWKSHCKDYYRVFLALQTAPMAYGGAQARGRIGAATADLHHSHSKAESKPCLRPTPQFTATPDT